jgi:hypothetical protein
MKVLIMKRFIIPFESGIVVIKHWKIHNYIRNDRYKPTVYTEEKAMLTSKNNGAYTEVDVNGIPSDNHTVYQMDTQYSIGKDRLELGEYSGSVGEDAAAANGEKSVENYKEDRLKVLQGIGKGVVYLTDSQMESLLDKLDIETFDRYIARLADFILKKNAHVKNHYDTILKWVAEDSKT